MAGPLASLLPYAANARTHPPEQVAQIAGSIAEFGFTVPVLVDEAGVLVAGHGRVLAARSLGLEVVPVIRLNHLSEAQLRAYRLADNQIALNGGWDEVLLAAELQALREEDVDLGLLGFGQGDLDRLLDAAPSDGGIVLGGDPDAPVPQPPDVPVARPGDFWRLGAHRLLCGGSTDAAGVARLLAGECPRLMITDPPYGVGYDPSWRSEAGISATARIGTVTNDHLADWRDAWALCPGDVA